jgi:hypothetical protein
LIDFGEAFFISEDGKTYGRTHLIDLDWAKKEDIRQLANAFEYELMVCFGRLSLGLSNTSDKPLSDKLPDIPHLLQSMLAKESHKRPLAAEVLQRIDELISIT